MNLIDNRSAHEKLYERLVAAFDKKTRAEEQVKRAEDAISNIWQEHLQSFSGRADHPVAYETVIVRDGLWLYQIDFDVDEYYEPIVKRVDEYLTIHKTE